MTARATAILATAAAILLTASLPASAGPPSHLIRVSHGDPYASCTLGSTPTSVLYPGAEVEPSLAVDPRHLARMVGVWQQDRWSDQAAHGIVAAYSHDGGHSFTEVPLPVSACAPGGLNYQRASDPWVSIGPDGTVYASALALDVDTPRNTVAATVSYDGGRTWRHTTALIDDTQEFFNDKNSVTADPRLAGTAYQVWDRQDGGPNGNLLLTSPTMLSVTHDFGRTWSVPKVIVPTDTFQQTIGNVIVADPRNGALYNIYAEFTYTDATASTIAETSFGLVRSTDGGRHWSAPITIVPNNAVTDVDPNTGALLRTSAGLPYPAIDPSTGALYVAYEGTDFTAGTYNQVELIRSTNGGSTWSLPVRVNAAHSSPAYQPSIAVTNDGQVGITYYDIRTLPADDTTTLPTSTWLTVSPRGGQHFGHERQIAPTFDYLAAPFASGYFLGDYQALVAVGDAFRPFFVTANSGQPNNSTDVYTGQFPAFGHHNAIVTSK